jgi:hypothetical protein
MPTFPAGEEVAGASEFKDALLRDLHPPRGLLDGDEAFEVSPISYHVLRPEARRRSWDAVRIGSRASLRASARRSKKPGALPQAFSGDLPATSGATTRGGR